ncbi:ribonuclease H-like domain-containing protein [Tanacetum coccineum]
MRSGLSNRSLTFQYIKLHNKCFLAYIPNHGSRQPYNKSLIRDARIERQDEDLPQTPLRAEISGTRQILASDVTATGGSIYPKSRLRSTLQALLVGQPSRNNDLVIPAELRQNSVEDSYYQLLQKLLLRLLLICITFCFYGLIISTRVFRRSLYGLKQAPRAWFQRFAAYAARVGFHHSRCDSSLFIYRQGADTAYLLLYVDDIVLTASSSDLLQQIITSLHAEFSMTDLGSLNYFLGISVTRNASGMFLSQQKYATEVLDRAGMLNCKPCRTPVDTDSKLSADGAPISDSTLYRSLAGALQYLTFTRPDISYAVQQVCLFMHDPREPHLSALKRILRYVRGTLSYGLQLYSSTTSSLVAYSDADWAGCPTTRRSTSGYCVFLGNNLLSWSSKRQFTLSRSSAEAEYRGVANAVAETCWLRNLLRELHTPLATATLVYCDNVSAVYLSSNPVQHQRTKHIEIDIHFVRDLVATGAIRVLHVPSRYQYADIFTKGLPTSLFDEFRTSLSVRSSPVQTAGEC